jgi:exonuclease VII small subunit
VSATPLEELIDELESVAERLREGQVDPEEAAALVERCAELAARVGGELDAQSRAASEAEGQERLL